MSGINGVVIGLVSKVNDKGMVKVTFPWLPDEPETEWIRIATAMAGKDRGTFFMPEEKDEVLVAFEHGDTNHPVVVGFLWNGKDTPPEKSKEVRRIKTKCGHTIEFNDKNGEEKIKIETPGKQEIEMNDTSSSIKIKTKSNSSVELKDKPGQVTVSTQTGTIKVDDTAPGNISVSTKMGSIEISNAPPGMISISTKAGNIMLDCLNASITAKAALTITAPTVTFGGVVQAPTIIAGSGQFGAVVSGAYNPLVPGNLLGL